MTRRTLLTSTLSLVLPFPALANPPAKAAPKEVAKAPSSPVPIDFTVIDLCAPEEADRVAISDAGTILLSTENADAKVPTRLWSKGKVIPLPSTFVGLDFGALGTVVGYVRVEDAKTRAALWKAGDVHELLSGTDGDNTRAITAGRDGTIVLRLAGGDCGLLAPDAKEAREVGRANIGDVVSDPFLPVAISADGTVIVGNQGDRAWLNDSGDWQEVVALPDAEQTVLTGMDHSGRLVCGYVSSGDPAKRLAWVRDLHVSDTDNIQPVSELAHLGIQDHATYPNATALAIADSGIVGFVAADGSAEKGARALLWKSGKAYDLNTRVSLKTPGWTVTEARAINGTNIVAIAEQNGMRRVVLLNGAH